MGKKMMFVVVASIFVSGMAYAGSQNDAGCGLGSLVFKDNNVPQQILAGTTNNSISPQSSAITTGTSGCTAADGNSKGESAQAERKQEVFAIQNWRDLNRQMASGNGEYVSTLSSLMGCSKNAQNAFAHFTQTHYTKIIDGAKANPVTVIKNLRAAVAQDPQMSLSCSLI